MIVISHPWEFTPKGNSHFNYLSSNATGLDQTSRNEPPPQSERQKNPNIQQQQQDQQQQKQQPSFYLPKSHLSRVFMPQQCQSNDMNNTTMSDISFSYYGKSPIISNNINFENNVAPPFFFC
jgi:hypothetical protein